MFILETHPQSDTQKTLENIKSKFGSVPPHFELLATLNPKRFELFILEIMYLSSHQNIKPDFFAFLRLHIARKEQFEYCLAFNTKLLLSKGYNEKTLKSVKDDIINIPFDDRHRFLADTAIRAIYSPNNFDHKDIQLLQERGWSHADIYDAIDHAAFLFKNAKIIKAYSKSRPV